MFWIILIIQAIIFGFATSYVAGQKGKDEGTWFLVGALLGIIGLLIIGFSKDKNNINKTNHETKESVKKQINTNKIIKNKTFNPTTDLNSPIDILWNSIIVKGNDVSLYSNFKNISDKKILSIIFDVECFNSFNKPASDNNIFENTIQDLNLLPEKNLHKNVYINLNQIPSTRKANIIIKNVLFNDEEIWQYNQNNLTNTELDFIPNSADLNAIRQIKGEDVICFPEIKNDKWICVCGRNNRINQEKCARCNRDKNETILSFPIKKPAKTTT